MAAVQHLQPLRLAIIEKETASARKEKGELSKLAGKAAASAGDSGGEEPRESSVTHNRSQYSAMNAWH